MPEKQRCAYSPLTSADRQLTETRLERPELPPRDSVGLGIPFIESISSAPSGVNQLLSLRAPIELWGYHRLSSTHLENGTPKGASRHESKVRMGRKRPTSLWLPALIRTTRVPQRTPSGEMQC